MADARTASDDDATEPTTVHASRVDGDAIDGEPGRAASSTPASAHGVYIPRFCYHPRMRPVGMCRMCIVEIDTGRGPALQPSCMIPVAAGHEGRHRVRRSPRRRRTASSSSC